MAEWPKNCLEGVAIDQILSLLNEFHFTDEQLQKWIINKAALCRLAFASIMESDEKPFPFIVPEEAIISSTEFVMGKGRPKTAEWAFWIAYIIKQELRGSEYSVTARFLSGLVSYLLKREIMPEKMRSILSERKKKAEKYALEAGKVILENSLKPHLSERQFRRYTKEYKEYLEEALNPDSQILGMVENGKVKEDWLEKQIRVRKAILRKTKKGLLGGQGPVVDVVSRTKVAVDLPLSPPPFYGTPKKDGLIHFGKETNVPVPMPLFDQEKRNGGDIGYSSACNKDGSTTSVRFPEHLLSKREPFVAALYAIPAWWFEWQTILVAPSKQCSLL